MGDRCDSTLLSLDNGADVAAIDLLHETNPTNCVPDLMGAVPDADSRWDTSCAPKLGGYAVVPGVSCIHYWSVRVTEDVGPETCD